MTGPKDLEVRPFRVVSNYAALGDVDAGIEVTVPARVPAATVGEELLGLSLAAADVRRSHWQEQHVSVSVRASAGLVEASGLMLAAAYRVMRWGVPDDAVAVADLDGELTDMRPVAERLPCPSFVYVKLLLRYLANGLEPPEDVFAIATTAYETAARMWTVAD